MRSLFICALMTYSLSAPASERTPLQKGCTALLTLELYEAQSPHGHYRKQFMDYVRRHPGTRVTSMSGNTIVVQTDQPYQLMDAVGEGLGVKSVEHEGRSLPIYGVPRLQPGDFTEGREAWVTQYQKRFFEVLAELPQGAYDLIKTVNGTQLHAAMFVTWKPNRDHFNGTRTLALEVNVFGGDTSTGGELMASFTDLTGVADGFQIAVQPEHFTLSYSLPYGYGDDEIILQRDPRMGTLRSVGLRGHGEFEIVGFRPLLNPR